MELIDITKPEIARAIYLATLLVEHCNRHNFPADTQVYGVAINAGCLETESYIQGEKDEKERMAMLLGLGS